MNYISDIIHITKKIKYLNVTLLSVHLVIVTNDRNLIMFMVSAHKISHVTFGCCCYVFSFSHFISSFLSPHPYGLFASLLSPHASFLSRADGRTHSAPETLLIVKNPYLVFILYFFHFQFHISCFKQLFFFPKHL